MALRGLARQLAPLASSCARGASSSAGSSAGGGTPTVFDKMVQIFVIDKSGVRHTVRGLEGSSLAATLQEYGRFGGDAFMPHVYDPAHADCHVYVQGEYLDRLTPLDATQQQEQAKLIADCVRAKARDNSRLGYYITLTPSLNGMTVALGDVEPWETQ